METKYIIAIVVVVLIIYFYLNKPSKTVKAGTDAKSSKHTPKEIMLKIDDRMFHGEMNKDEFIDATGGTEVQYMDLYELYEGKGGATIEDYEKIFK